MWGLDPVWGCCPTSTPALALPLVAPLGPGAKAKSQQLLAVLIGCRPAVQDGPRTKQPTVPSPPGAGQTPDSALGLHSILWSAKSWRESKGQEGRTSPLTRAALACLLWRTGSHLFCTPLPIPYRVSNNGVVAPCIFLGEKAVCHSKAEVMVLWCFCLVGPSSPSEL